MSKARHPIHVAVMRLFKPPFSSEPAPPVPMLRSEWDLGNTHALSGLLTLPETPGETYLGQHFNAFVRITNTHSRPLKSVKLTVELVTPRVRHVFTDKRDATKSKSQPVELAVDDGLDIVIEHLLVEQGTHRLRVTVSYVWPETGASDTCVKQYPVRVERPISVNLRTRTRPDQNQNQTLVEAQLQNTTSENVLLDTVRFAPAPGFVAKNLGMEMQAEQHMCLNVMPLGSEEIGCVGKVVDDDGRQKNTRAPLLQRIIRRQQDEQERILLRPSQIHQYLFQIKAQDEKDKTQVQKKPAVVAANKVGRISMVWKTTMGETAKLQTAFIERELPEKKGVELTLVSQFPGTMVLGERYCLRGRLTNHTTLSTSVRVNFGGEHQLGGIVVCGWSCKIFDSINAKSSLEFDFDVTPMEAGLQSLGGAVLEDIGTGVKSSVDKLATVFVKVHEEKQEMER